MRKILLIGCCLTAFLLTACDNTVDKPQQEPLLVVFDALEAEPQSLRLTGWNIIESELLPQEGLEKRAADLVDQIGLTVDEQRADSDTNWRQLRLQGTKEGRKYEFTWQSLPGETYLIMDIQAQGEVASFEHLRQQMRQLLGADCNSYALITATLPGQYSAEKMERLFKKAIRHAGGKEVSAEGEGDYLCYSAYLESAGNSARLRGQEVNIQLVGDYNENQNITYLYLGLPLVFSDY